MSTLKHSFSNSSGETFLFVSLVTNLYVLFIPTRLADHFGGKLHMGFIKIRDRLKELQVMLKWSLQENLWSFANSIVQWHGLLCYLIPFSV